MTFPDDPLAVSQLCALDFVLNAVFAPTAPLTREQLVLFQVQMPR